MSEQYLILHKVRGEPSFDCATKLMIGDEEGWITNSGYRAYPYWHKKINEIIFDLNGTAFEGIANPIPADWPDHFQVEGEKPPPSFNIMNAIQGLMPKIKRRV